MAEIELYGFDASTYLQSVKMVCDHLDLQYHTAPLEFGADSHLALHPFARMPVMKHGKLTLYETAAILSYIDDISGKASLVPGASIEKARMWQVMSLAVDYGYEALVRVTFAEDATAIDTKGAKTCLNALEIIIADNPYFAGAALSFADFIVAPMVAHFVGIVPDGNRLLCENKAVAAWYKKMNGLARREREHEC